MNQLQGPVSEPPGPHSDCRCCRSHPVSDRGGLESDGVKRDFMFTAAASTGRDSRFVLAQTSNANSSPRRLYCGDPTVCQPISSDRTLHQHTFFSPPLKNKTQTHTQKKTLPKNKPKKVPDNLAALCFLVMADGCSYNKWSKNLCEKCWIM